MLYLFISSTSPLLLWWQKSFYILHIYFYFALNYALCCSMDSLTSSKLIKHLSIFSDRLLRWSNFYSIAKTLSYMDSRFSHMFWNIFLTMHALWPPCFSTKHSWQVCTSHVMQYISICRVCSSQLGYGRKGLVGGSLGFRKVMFYVLLLI